MSYLQVRVPTKYPTAYGDTWFSTWADDGNLYVTSNDSTGFNGTCNGGHDTNIVVNELVGADPTALTAPFVNCMTSYRGRTLADRCSWKTGNITSVEGTLYLAVARQLGGCSADQSVGLQPSFNASIVKSTDHGRTWSNSFGTTHDRGGAAPTPDPALGRVDAMFPGRSFAAPFFVQYGRDDDPAGAVDGADRYVYVVSNDSFAYDGNHLVLARVARDRIGALDAADWQYYTGSVGGDGLDGDSWSGTVTSATHILTAEHQLSQPSIQYVPSIGRYIMINFYYPYDPGFPLAPGSSTRSTFSFYEAPHPWGPWTNFLSRPTTMTMCYVDCQSRDADVPLGLYDPALVGKFMRMNGLSNVVFASGDFKNKSRAGEEQLYELHSFPFRLSTEVIRAVDDDSTELSFHGDWKGQVLGDRAFDVGNDHYRGTSHHSNTPGDSVVYSFAGSTIEWIGGTSSDHGRAEVSIDGGPPTTVDSYSATSAKQVTLFRRNDLPSGRHRITVTVTGGRSAGAHGTYQDVDVFVVDASSRRP